MSIGDISTLISVFAIFIAAGSLLISYLTFRTNRKKSKLEHYRYVGNERMHILNTVSSHLALSISLREKLERSHSRLQSIRPSLALSIKKQIYTKNTCIGNLQEQYDKLKNLNLKEDFTQDDITKIISLVDVIKHKSKRVSECIEVSLEKNRKYIELLAEIEEQHAREYME